MLRPNTILKGQYRIIRRIGHGGMGAVYEVLDDELDALVALKETFAETDAQREAFAREAKLLANLEHDAFPKVMRHFFEGDGQYLVMELVRGNDLEELLKLRESPFAPAKVLGWADQLLDALEELHSYPIIHRDIKPSNLKLTKRDKIKLLDFGIAKGAAGQMTTVGTDRSGGGYTAHYAPLEQVLRSDWRWSEILRNVNPEAVERIQQKATDARSDLYALGATLYHLMASVVPPPDAPSRALSLWTGKPDPLRPAHELNPLVPLAVSAVLRQAMNLERNERPATAAELRQMLREAANQPLSETPTLLLPELEERARQRREAEAQRRAEEDKTRKLAEEEAQRRAAVEAQANREAAEAARRAAAADEQRRREEEERQREEEERKRATDEEAQRQREAEERRKREAENARLEEEAARRKQAADEAEAAKRAEEEAAASLAAEQEAERLRAEKRAQEKREFREAAARYREGLHRSREEPHLHAGASERRPAAEQSATAVPPHIEMAKQQTVHDPFAIKTIPAHSPTALPDGRYAMGNTARATQPREGKSKRALLVIILTASIALVLAAVALLWMRRTSDSEQTASQNATRAVSSEAGQMTNTSSTAATPQPPPGMVYVSGGTIMMGRNKEDGGDEYEHPAHRVTVKEFFIDAYEVTCEEYKECVDAGQCPQPQGWINGNYLEGTKRQPVTGVMWDAAHAYAKWADKRLPTEAEWEYAARGKDERRYPWGNGSPNGLRIEAENKLIELRSKRMELLVKYTPDWPEVKEIDRQIEAFENFLRQNAPPLANLGGISDGLADVGAFKGASPFGAFDMVGNAWEWTDSKLTAYQKGQLLPNKPPGDLRVIRGGSYLEDRSEATTTYRRGYPINGNYDYGKIGFRCAKDVSNSTNQN